MNLTLTSGADPGERFQDLITGDLIGNERAGVMPVALIEATMPFLVLPVFQQGLQPASLSASPE